MFKEIMSITTLAGVWGMVGCVYSNAAKLLPAPSGTHSAAIEDNDKGIQVYHQGR